MDRKKYTLQETMLVAGIDEVGRGCVAGPVVACALVLSEGFCDSRIKDSKKMTRQAREKLVPVILKNSITYGLGVVCSAVIDKVNILNATKQAMQIALSKLETVYDKVIVDAVRLNHVSVPTSNPFKADALFQEVSAASIVAKVYRDSLMKNMSRTYPGYGWETNAGYGTGDHIEAIRRLGYTPLHRRSFSLKGL